MKFGTKKYFHWKAKKNEELLQKRSKRLLIKKRKKTNVLLGNLKDKALADYEGNYHHFKAPSNFSLFENTEETVDYFNGLLKFISSRKNRSKHILIDLSDVKHFSVDSSIYLLSICKSLKEKYKHNFHFKGNSPKDRVARKIFDESGFIRFFKHSKNDSPKLDPNVFQITYGQKNSTDIAKRLVDFFDNKSRNTSFLYCIMMELMSNTQQHAYKKSYDDNSIFDPNWYCFAKKYPDKMNLVFLDVGFGIPSTIKKKISEKIIDFVNVMNVFTSDDKYLLSALKGEFRSETKLDNRGKGLPEIMEYCSNKDVDKMRIISNKADVQINRGTVSSNAIKSNFKGTLFSIDIMNK